MKKLTALILARVLALSLAACKDKTTTKKASSGSNLTSDQVEKIMAQGKEEK